MTLGRLLVVVKLHVHAKFHRYHVEEKNLCDDGKNNTAVSFMAINLQKINKTLYTLKSTE